MYLLTLLLFSPVSAQAGSSRGQSADDWQSQLLESSTGATPLDPIDFTVRLPPLTREPMRWRNCKDLDTDWCCMNLIWLYVIPQWLVKVIIPRVFYSHDTIAIGLNEYKEQAMVFNCTSVIRLGVFQMHYAAHRYDLDPPTRNIEDELWNWERVKKESPNKVMALEYGRHEMACQNPPWEVKLIKINTHLTFNDKNERIDDYHGVCKPDAKYIKERTKAEGSDGAKYRTEIENTRKKLDKLEKTLDRVSEYSAEVAQMRPDATLIEALYKLRLGVFLTPTYDWTGGSNWKKKFMGVDPKGKGKGSQ